MNKTKNVRPVFFIFLAVAVIGLLAVLLANGHSTVMPDGQLMMFGEDFSDSAVGWAIAIPILILAAVVLAIVLAGTGVLVAGVLVMALVMTLVAAVFAVSVTVLPLLAFIAVPILAIVGLVKILSRPAKPAHAVIG